VHRETHQDPSQESGELLIVTSSKVSPRQGSGAPFFPSITSEKELSLMVIAHCVDTRALFMLLLVLVLSPVALGLGAWLAKIWKR